MYKLLFDYVRKVWVAKGTVHFSQNASEMLQWCPDLLQWSLTWGGEGTCPQHSTASLRMFLKGLSGSQQHLKPQSTINTLFQLEGKSLRGFIVKKLQSHHVETTLKKKQQCCKRNCLAWPYTFLHSPYRICTKKCLLPFLLLIALVCKLLSIPVYPEWWANQASHVAKGRSECTGDGPHLREEAGDWNQPVFHYYLSTN